jgi:hypothetical protein
LYGNPASPRWKAPVPSKFVNCTHICAILRATTIGIAHHFEPHIYEAGDFRLFRAFSFALTLIGVDLENQNVVAVLIAALVILLACLADSHCEWPS